MLWCEFITCRSVSLRAIVWRIFYSGSYVERLSKFALLYQWISCFPVTENLCCTTQAGRPPTSFIAYEFAGVAHVKCICVRFWIQGVELSGLPSIIDFKFSRGPYILAFISIMMCSFVSLLRITLVLCIHSGNIVHLVFYACHVK